MSGSRSDRLPAFYAILDAAAVAQRGLDLLATARELRAAGVRLLQFRDKQANASAYMEEALKIAAIFKGSETILILNDHAAHARAAAWNGVHLGQSDLSPGRARALLGPGALIGLSTHTLQQAHAAEQDAEVDYIAFGPIYPTLTKLDPEPVVGLDLLREISGAVTKPVVAIGGITAERIPEVLGAGAQSAALIGALFADGTSVQRRAEALIRLAGDGGLRRPQIVRAAALTEETFSPFSDRTEERE